MKALLHSKALLHHSTLSAAASTVTGAASRNKDSGGGRKVVSALCEDRRRRLFSSCCRVPPFYSLLPSVPIADQMQLLNTSSSPLLLRSRPPRVVLARHFNRNVLDPKQMSSSVSLLEIKRFLRQKGQEFAESHACLSITVPKHILLRDTSPTRPTSPPSSSSPTSLPPPPPPPSSWKALDHSLSKIFINKTTGGFVCPDLALSGDWKTLQSFLVVWHHNKTLKKGEAAEAYPSLGAQLDLSTPKEVEDLWQRCVPVESLPAKEFKDMLKHFRLPVRDLKPEDFSRYDVRITETQDKLVFPVRYAHPSSKSVSPLIGLRCVSLCPSESGLLVEENVPAVAPNPPVVQEEGVSSSVSRMFPFPHGLDIAQRCQAKSVVLLTSALDSVCLSARCPNVVPVALADGAAYLPPDHLPFFEPFDKISLWFPNDASSFDSARTFAKKLGDKRCYMVGRDFANPSACLRKRESIADVLKYRLKPCCHEYITTFESLREDVFLEMAHYEEVEGIKWKRFEALNELIRGFRRGELTVFTGKTGTGKTTFMSEYSLDLCMQGINTLWGSFEVKNIRLAKMQLKQFSAVNLEENLDQFDAWADRFQKLPMYYLTFHGAHEIDKVLDAMGHAVYIYDIAHVIIDNIQFMMGTSARTMDRFYFQDTIIQKFRKFATLHNVHVTLVIHPRKEDDERLTANSIFGGAKATQEADNVILLQEEEINLKLKRKFIQVVKNRFSGDIGIVPLFFNKGTLTFSKKIFQREKNIRRKKESPKLEEMTADLEDCDKPPKETLLPPE